MDIRKCLEILGIDEDASLDEVKQAYRDMVKVWHPDRFSNDPRLQKKAERAMRDVNLAYETLISYFSTDQSYTAVDDFTSNDEEWIVICPTCGTRNRIISYSPDLVPVCGKCGFPLYDDGEPSEHYSYWEERIPCSDGTCIGIIGLDGRCGVCGKPFQSESTTSAHQETPVHDDATPPLSKPSFFYLRKATNCNISWHCVVRCCYNLFFQGLR